MPSSDWFRIRIREAASSFAQDRGKSPGPYPALASLITALTLEPGAKAEPDAARFGFVSVGTLPTTPDRRRGVELIMRSAATTDVGQHAGVSKIRDGATRIAAQTGMSIEVTHAEFAPAVINNAELVQMLRAPLERVIGKANLNQDDFYFPAADDVALFMREVPGIFLLLGVNAPGLGAGQAPTNHSPDFFVNESTLASGVKALATLSYAYLDACSERPEQSLCR